MARIWLSAKCTVASGSGKACTRLARAFTRPRKSVSTSSTLRRPTLSPRKNAASGTSRIGTEGWPTLPRTGSPLAISPSSSSTRMMTETVCADSPVARAIPALAMGPWRRRSVRTRRPLWSRMAPWLEPRPTDFSHVLKQLHRTLVVQHRSSALAQDAQPAGRLSMINHCDLFIDTQPQFTPRCEEGRRNPVDAGLPTARHPRQIQGGMTDEDLDQGPRHRRVRACLFGGGGIGADRLPDHQDRHQPVLRQDERGRRRPRPRNWASSSSPMPARSTATTRPRSQPSRPASPTAPRAS